MRGLSARKELRSVDWLHQLQDVNYYSRLSTVEKIELYAKTLQARKCDIYTVPLAAGARVIVFSISVNPSGKFFGDSALHLLFVIAEVGSTSNLPVFKVESLLWWALDRVGQRFRIWNIMSDNDGVEYKC